MPTGGHILKLQGEPDVVLAAYLIISKYTVSSALVSQQSILCAI